MNQTITRVSTAAEFGNSTGIPANERTSSVELFTTGIEGLDDILKGGLARDHLYLIEGDPGTGKSWNFTN